MKHKCISTAAELDSKRDTGYENAGGIGTAVPSFELTPPVKLDVKVRLVSCEIFRCDAILWK